LYVLLFVLFLFIALPFDSFLPRVFLSFGFALTDLSVCRYLVAATTIWSGMSYVFSNNAVKILTKEEIQKRIAQAETKRKH
jgi:cardiolipin synthase